MNIEKQDEIINTFINATGILGIFLSGYAVNAIAVYKTWHLYLISCFLLLAGVFFLSLNINRTEVQTT